MKHNRNVQKNSSPKAPKNSSMHVGNSAPVSQAYAYNTNQANKAINKALSAKPRHR